MIWNFNPRPREEGDKQLLQRLCKQNNFNPRPREEGDIRFFIPFIFKINFNPRPREEGDKFPKMSKI